VNHSNKKTPLHPRGERGGFRVGIEGKSPFIPLFQRGKVPLVQGVKLNVHSNRKVK